MKAIHLPSPTQIVIIGYQTENTKLRLKSWLDKNLLNSTYDVGLHDTQ